MRLTVLVDVSCEGTGKTLVAVMLMSRLLSLNPHHSVVFVVDRILLALQQTSVIRKELAHKLFDRFRHVKVLCTLLPDIVVPKRHRC